MSAGCPHSGLPRTPAVRRFGGRRGLRRALRDHLSRECDAPRMSSSRRPVMLPSHGPLLRRRAGRASSSRCSSSASSRRCSTWWCPPDSAFHLSDYAVGLVGKIMCYAICALAMDLIWGYTGILSLGHGLFFALGGYAMGMYLMRQIGRDGNYKSDLPDFMVFLDWKALPWHWTLQRQLRRHAAAGRAVPGLLAFVFGFFAFRSRIKGVYFSIITQAMTFAAMLLFFRNETGFGGNNGFTDFKRILGIADRHAADAHDAVRRSPASRCSASS